jgi:hypothetical protein
MTLGTGWKGKAGGIIAMLGGIFKVIEGDLYEGISLFGGGLGVFGIRHRQG